MSKLCIYIIYIIIDILRHVDLCRTILFNLVLGRRLCCSFVALYVCSSLSFQRWHQKHVCQRARMAWLCWMTMSILWVLFVPDLQEEVSFAQLHASANSWHGWLPILASNYFQILTFWLFPLQWFWGGMHSKLEMLMSYNIYIIIYIYTYLYIIHGYYIHIL